LFLVPSAAKVTLLTIRTDLQPKTTCLSTHAHITTSAWSDILWLNQVETKRIDLLRHPLVTSLLNDKWDQFWRLPVLCQPGAVLFVCGLPDFICFDSSQYGLHILLRDQPVDWVTHAGTSSIVLLYVVI